MNNFSNSVPLAEAKAKFSDLVDRVSRGEEFVITRHETEIARLVPVRRPSRDDVTAAISKLRATRPNRPALAEEIASWTREERR